MKKWVKILSDKVPTNKYYKHNGVRVEKRNFIKDYFGWGSGDDPSREGGIVKSHELLTRPGDSVVIVGGGTGITGVRAAQIVREQGGVSIFEGGNESVRRIKNILKINKVENICNVLHAIVGNPSNVYGGSQKGAKCIPPKKYLHAMS